MYRSIRLFAIAAVAAAFVPVAHASTANQPGDWAQEVPAAAGVAPAPCGWVTVTDDLGISWITQIPETCPPAVEAETQKSRAPASAATDTKAHKGKPSTAKQRGFWGMRTRSHRRVVAPAPFITDNSPSQNRVAPRRVAVVRTLASTLHTFPG